MTTFCHAKVKVAPGLEFTIDGNSKITAGNGSYENPTPNALSLPHISTCPGSTSLCRRACYVHGLQKNAPEVYAAYAENERVLHAVLMDPFLSATAPSKLGAWISTNCSGGFRWHVSGDVISVAHALLIRAVCWGSPSVRHWIYTRTLGAVPFLVGADNLTVNISADYENYADARCVANEHGLRLCYMTNDGSIPADMRAGDVVFPDYPFRGRELPDPTDHEWWKALTIEQKRMVCVGDFFGQSERHRCGPCGKCLEAT